MPEITDEELQRLQRLESQNVAMELDLAKTRFLAEHPHVPATLIQAFQGSPEQINSFGQELLKQFPAPSSGGQQATVQPGGVMDPAGQSNLQAAAPPNPAVIPNPAVAAQQPEPQPARPPHPASQIPTATTPPIMAQPLSPVPDSPAAMQQRYQQQMAAVQPYSGGMQPVPQPGMAAQVDQQNAREAQSGQIRERMAAGVATKAEAEWLAQWGTRGFVASMQNHAYSVTGR
jgi:hypothetical protein